jgi:hypothetical protein
VCPVPWQPAPDQNIPSGTRSCRPSSQEDHIILALLQLMDEQRKSPLPVFSLIDDRRINGPTYSPYRTSCQLFMQEFMLAYQRDTEMFPDHPLNMLRIESMVGDPCLDPMFSEHLQKALVSSRMMPWITENTSLPLKSPVVSAT